MNSKLQMLILGIWLSQSAASASETKSPFEKYLIVAEHEKYAQALYMIDKLQRSSPNDDLYLAERGRMNMNLDRHKPAIDDCTKALVINPKNFNALRTRSYCYFMLRDYKSGLRDADLLAKYTEPDFVTMWPKSDHDNRAQAYMLTGRPDLARKEKPLCELDQIITQAIQAREGAGMNRALELVNKVLAKDPKNLSALGFKGVCLNNLTKFKESIAVFSQALAQKPNCPVFLYYRADAYRETRQFEKAIADFTKILAVKPRLVLFRYATHTGRQREEFSHTDMDGVNLADIYFLRASCYEGLKKNELAIKDYKKVLELDNKEYKTAASLGNALFNSRKYDDAIKFYTQALSINPEYWEGYTLRSRAYEQIGDVEKAAKDLTVVITNNPKDTGAYALRGLIYKRSKQYQKAIDDFTKMIETAPADDEGFRERADCLVKIGQFERAIKDYDRALKFNSEDKEAIAKARSDVLTKMGKKKDRLD